MSHAVMGDVKEMGAMDAGVPGPHRLEVAASAEGWRIAGRHFVMSFCARRGTLTQIDLFNTLDCARRDEAAGTPLLPDGAQVGLDSRLPVESCQLLTADDQTAHLRVVQGDEHWRLVLDYHIHVRGYVTCAFELEALQDQAALPVTELALPVAGGLLGRPHHWKNTSNDPELRQSTRGLSLNFSVDDRPVTHAVDLLLEHVTHDLTGKALFRFHESDQAAHRAGWKLTRTWRYACPAGYTYRNRWALTLTAFDNGPSPVRAQRIYHWSSLHPAFPDDQTLEELAEYGCSILIIHMPSLKHIDTCQPRDEKAMSRVVAQAHVRGMKVMVYCQPYLISQHAPHHQRFLNQRTECLGIWLSDSRRSQICFYEPNLDFDADELCLRCDEAYAHMRDAPLACLERYNLDGLYIDWAWPAQGLCSDPSHDHAPGLFNFHDYLRILRDWRQAIGPDKLMIGHGGGFLVGSDMVEGFDACLTGEAQVELDAATIGQQFGIAPTLWTLQRRKQDVFRSRQTIEQLIRQAMTPHLGLGVTGTSVIASLDPAHFPELLALWQMWRAFPVERARVYFEPMTPGHVTLDNDEVVYSLYVTPQGQAMLILANAGGPRCDDAPAIGVNVQLDLTRLGLADTLHAWRIRGDRYETLRIASADAVRQGRLTIPELGLHEVTALVLSPDQPPMELTRLQQHLAGRADRLGALQLARQQRLARMDEDLDRFVTLPNASVYFSYDDFMAGRVAE